MRYVSIAAAVVLAAALPLVVLAQVAGGPNPDDLGAIAGFVINALRGGDYSIAIFAGLVLLVGIVRKLATNIPALGTWFATDLGGALLMVATVVPIAFLTADLAGQPLTFDLAWKALGGGLIVFTLVRKILRPLFLLIPGRVGQVLVALLDFASGVVPKPALAPAPV